MSGASPPRPAPAADPPSGHDPFALDRAAARRLLIVMSRAFKAMTTPMRQHLARWDLSPTEFAVLEALYHKGPLPLGEVAGRVLVTGASTTYCAKALEQRGLMRRRPSREDQRVVFAELTEAGRALIAEVFPAHTEELRRTMSGLTRQEKRAAAELLRKLAHAPAATDVAAVEDDPA